MLIDGDAMLSSTCQWLDLIHCERAEGTVLGSASPAAAAQIRVATTAEHSQV